ncbi:flagellar assembly protein FliH [Bacillus salitolerans]|uniref:Flagellar assembly protein FliH n=1 Tax=Bacillus salitolerans TaxID=1437434 RepID=A0ABW4LKY8_9BACI
MSRLIKSHNIKPQHEEKKVIHLQSLLSMEELEVISPKIEADQLKEEAQHILEDARKQAETLIKEAEEQLRKAQLDIQHLKDQWENEKLELTERTTNEAFSEGYQKGESEAKAHFSLMLEQVESIVNQAKNDYHMQVEKSEETILRIGLKVAEKIIHVQLDEHRSDFMQVVKQAIKEVKDHSDINIIVHPSVYEIVLAQKDELQAIYNREKNLFIYPDEDLKETDCIIESSFGRIDASIDSQLSELKIKLFELLEEGKSDEGIRSYS